MPHRTIQINRAPVLTLWAAVVAERLGFDRPAALTLGRALAGLNAQAKGQRLGIFHPRDHKEQADSVGLPPPGEVFAVVLLDRQVPAVNTEQGVRASDGDKPADPQSVERYLHVKFGENLDQVREAMETLAGAFQPNQLAVKAYSLYERFRPAVPQGKQGWGALGELDLDRVVSLARSGS